MLFPDLSALPEGCPVFMAEDQGLGTHRRYHLQKLVLFLSAALLCEVHSEDAYRWFTEMFVDSAG